MYCPQCRSEYREGFTRCATCQIELTPELPSEDAFSSPEAMAASLAEADLQAIVVGNHVDLLEVQRFLASNHIASVIAGEASHQVETPLHQRLFLLIEAAALERARALIYEQWRDGAIAQGLLLNEAPLCEGKCPACSTPVASDVVECPECGLFLGDGEERSEIDETDSESESTQS